MLIWLRFSYIMLLMYCFSQGELSHVDQLEDRTHLPSYTSMLEALSVKIDRISCEVIKKKNLNDSD